MRVEASGTDVKWIGDVGDVTPVGFSATIFRSTPSAFGNTQCILRPLYPQAPECVPYASLFGNTSTASNTGNPFGGHLCAIVWIGTASRKYESNPPLFGSSFAQSTQPNSLFANKAAAPTLGNSFSGSQGMSTGIFGASANLPGAQGTMTASISRSIDEKLPIFATLPPDHALSIWNKTLRKRKVVFFVDIPANSKLRDYGSSLPSSAAGGNALNGSMSLITGKPNVLSLTKTDNSRA